MYGIDETTRTPKNLVLKAGTDRLMVEATGVTLTAEDITLDMTDTITAIEAVESAVNDAQTSNDTKLDEIIALLTTIAANTAP